MERKIKPGKPSRNPMSDMDVDVKPTAGDLSAPVFSDNPICAENEQLLESIADGVTVLDQKGIIHYVNRAAKHQIGSLASKLIGKPVSDYITGIGSDNDYMKAIAASFSNKVPKPGHYLLRFTTGATLTMHLTFLLKEDPLSKSRYLWIIHRDMTRELTLKEDVRCMKQRLDYLIENSPDIILNADLNGTILFVNPGTAIGKQENIIGTTVYDHILPNDHEKIRKEFNCVFNSGKEGGYESSGIGADGIVRWYFTRIIPIKHDNQVIAVSLNSRDNSAKKQAEEELRNSQKMLDAVLHTIPGTLVVLDRKLNIIASNQHGLRQISLEVFDNKKRCYEYCWQREKPCADCYAKTVFRSGKPLTAEVYIQESNRYKEVNLHPIFNDAGAVRYVVEQIQDITLRKKSEEKIAMADMKTVAAQQLKSDFLSKISHELKTPMIGILGFSKLGIDRHKKVTKEKLKSYFSTILESGEKLQSLLNNLVDLSQLEGGNMGYDLQPEKLSLITTIILNELFTLLKKHRITVDFETPEFPDLVTADADRIGKVIHNLLTNAITFSKPQSIIKVRIEEMDSQIQFSVTDTGQGIPDDELTLIFENFSQSSRTKCKSGGRGLGLAISKRIITDHNGSIWAENKPTGGSVFKFLLPKPTD